MEVFLPRLCPAGFGGETPFSRLVRFWGGRYLNEAQVTAPVPISAYGYSRPYLAMRRTPARRSEPVPLRRDSYATEAAPEAAPARRGDVRSARGGARRRPAARARAEAVVDSLRGRRAQHTALRRCVGSARAQGQSLERAWP